MLGPRKSSKPRIGISPFEGFWKVTHSIVRDLLDWDFRINHTGFFLLHLSVPLCSILGIKEVDMAHG
jgi:hypothetical protein